MSQLRKRICISRTTKVEWRGANWANQKKIMALVKKYNSKVISRWKLNDEGGFKISYDFQVDKTPGGAWCDISTLICLPGDSRKIQIAYCLEATGFIEFKDVIINKLKGDIFKRIK
jgi:hypothetical protein